MLSAGLPNLSHADDLRYLSQSLVPYESAAAASGTWRTLVRAAMASKRTVVNNVLHIALGHRKAGSGAVTARDATAAIDDAQNATTHMLSLRNAKERASAIEVLLAHAIAASKKRSVDVSVLELADVGKWSAKCAVELGALLARTVEQLVLTRSVALRDTLHLVFSTPPLMLSELDLTGCRLHDAHLASLWHAMPPLARLSLDGCKLTDASVPLMSELLYGTSGLRVLALKDNRFTERGLAQLETVIARIATVRVLYVGVDAIEKRAQARAVVAERNAARAQASVCDSMQRPKHSHMDMTDAVMLSCMSHQASGSQSHGPSGAHWQRVRTLTLARVGLTSSLMLLPAFSVAVSLVTLSLRHNRLTELSRAVTLAIAEACPRLAELDLSFNRLRSLPTALGLLKNLRWLSVRGNELASLPPIAPVEFLDISSNAIVKWPMALDATALAACRELLMTNNRLSSIPAILLGSLPALQRLSLRGNPLMHLPAELTSVVDAAAVAAALRALTAAPAPASCVRVLRVGAPASDKSAVARLLCGKPPAPPSADAVQVLPWTVSSTRTVALFDFNGSARSPTYAFFLSKRTVNLIFVNLADVDAGFTEHCLQKVFAVGTPIKVIVVGTHDDDLPSGEAERRLQQLNQTVLRRFRKLTCCVVSRKAPESIETLRQAVLEDVEAMALGYAELPCERALAQKLGALRAGGTTMLSWQAYSDVAAALSISHEALLEITRSLHCAGALMWFEATNLRDTVILDPLFVGAVFGTVMMYNHSPRVGSFLSESDIRASMPAALASRDIGSVTALLETFDIIYRLPQVPVRFLVPLLLNEARLSIGAVQSEPGALRASWTRTWKFPHLVPSLFFGRLMSRVLESFGADNVLLWSNGLLLRFVAGGVTPDSRELHDVHIDVQLAHRVLRATVRAHELLQPPPAHLPPPPSSSPAPPPPTPQSVLMRVVNKIETLAVAMGCSDGVVREMLCNCARCSEPTAVPTRFAVSETPMTATASPPPLVCGGVSVALHAVAPDLTLYNIFDSVCELREIELSEEIGRGAFGKVSRGTWRGMQVAVKELVCDEADSLLTPSAWHEFCNEARIHAALSHPCIVRHMAVISHPPSIVTEFCSGGNLSDFLERPVSSVSETVRIVIALNIAQALEYIHTQPQPLLHRDVRSPNVFMTRDNDASLAAALFQGEPIAKLGDFGLATDVRIGRQQLESWIWMAPETRGMMALYTDRADIFSYAMVVYNVMTHELPFTDLLAVRDSWRVERDVSDHGRRPSGLTRASSEGTVSLPPVLVALVEQCWAEAPDSRPPASVIVARLRAARADASSGRRPSDEKRWPLRMGALVDRRGSMSEQRPSMKGEKTSL